MHLAGLPPRHSSSPTIRPLRDRLKSHFRAHYYFPFAPRGSTVSGRQRKLRTPLSFSESPSRITNTTASPSTCCSSPGLGGMASTTAIALRSSLRHAASLDVPVRAKLSGTDDDEIGRAH